jgi:hypothetical protein
MDDAVSDRTHASLEPSHHLTIGLLRMYISMAYFEPPADDGR